MRVTTKGQVTIPRHVRETLGIAPESEVEFREEQGRFYIVKTSKHKVAFMEKDLFTQQV